MSVKVSRANSLYGYPSPQSNQFLDPIVTNRAPLTSDRGIPGQAWVDQTNNLAYMFNKNSAGLAQWIQIVAGGGAGVFTSLTVTGALTQSNGNVDISDDVAPATVNIATGAAAKTLNLSSNDAGSVTRVWSDLVIASGGKGLSVRAGTIGSATITAGGNIIVLLATITANDRVLISRTSTGGAAIGQPVVTIQVGTSFTITCYDADGVTVTLTDLGVFNYFIVREV
jgi:hypothetical protein